MFDATQYVSQNTESATMERSPIPEGKYVAKMTGFERRAMKSGNGEMLNVEFTVTVGSTARKCWHNFNMTHTKPQTVEIAMQQLGNFCIAGGYNSIQDPWNPVELMDKEIEVYIAIDGQYNRIKGFYKKEMTPVEQGQAVYGQQPQTQQPTAPAPNPAPTPTGGNVDDEIPF